MKTIAARKAGRPSDPALRERRRREILDAAARLFARHGYSDTDTQDLADKLGVAKGTLYRYFPTKRELFLAAVDRVMHRLREQIDVAVSDIEEPLDRIARAVEEYLVYFADNPDFVELLIQERAQFKDRKKPTYFEHREANIERWSAMYRDMIAKGRVRTVPVERITDVFGQLMYGTIFINYFRGPQKSPQEQAKDILDIVYHGILTDEGRRRRHRRTE
jgi:AcrR family transcriptional regulator